MFDVLLVWLSRCFGTANVFFCIFIYTETKAVWLVLSLSFGDEFLNSSDFEPSIAFSFDIWDDSIYTNCNYFFFTFVLISNKLSAPICRNHLLRQTPYWISTDVPYFALLFFRCNREKIAFPRSQLELFYTILHAAPSLCGVAVVLHSR